MFLYNSLSKLDNYSIHSDWRLLSDYVPLTIVIPIAKEYIISSKYFIIKDSKEESTFIKDLINYIRNIDTSNISDITSLDRAVNEFASTCQN